MCASFPTDTSSPFLRTPATFRHLVEWVDGERACCPFLDISVRVAAERGPLTMRITGRPGTKAFIKADAALWLRPVKRPAGARSGDEWIGKAAPGFRLEALGGGTVSLSDLRGKVVLVNFWATWCGPCRVEVPWLVESQRRYRSDGLVVVGVSVDDGARKKVQAFAREMRVNYAIALKDASVADAYGGLRYLPQTFFVGRGGTIVARSYGIVDREALEADVKLALGASLNRLTIIQRARAAGFSLADIRELFSGYSEAVPASRRWKDLTRRKHAELEAAVRRIRDMQSLLEKMARCGCEELDKCGGRIRGKDGC